MVSAPSFCERGASLLVAGEAGVRACVGSVRSLDRRFLDGLLVRRRCRSYGPGTRAPDPRQQRRIGRELKHLLRPGSYAIAMVQTEITGPDRR